jgi:hypothetical protein
VGDYLKPVEDRVDMLMDDTALTSRARREAVKATKWCITDIAYPTRGGLSSQVQRFMFDELVGKLFPVLKPLLKVGLNRRED